MASQYNDDDTYAGDTYAGDTFAEAAADETGPSPNEDEFTRYEDRSHADDYTRSDRFMDTDDFTTGESEDPGIPSPDQGPVEGPYFDDQGRPYYINANGEPYYDDNYEPPEASMSLVAYDPQDAPQKRSYRDRYANANQEMMVYDPDMASAEDDDDDYGYDEAEPIDYHETYEDEIIEDESRRRARRRRAWCCCLICLCFLLLLLLLSGTYLILTDETPETAETPAPTFSPWIDDTDDDFWYDDDIVLQPGYVTSCMADFEGDCKFQALSCFPNVVDQCNCNGQIEIVPQDVKDMRGLIVERVAKKFFGSNFTMPGNSCNPINMAMIWFAAGNNRDEGQARQRFTLAINYYSLNGTIWDYDDAWMTDMNECLWLGVQCNNQDAVNSIQMDTNNLFGQFPSEIGLLKGLASISASRAHLTGTLPTELFGMPRLRELRLYGNRITGTIPIEIGNSPVLRGFRMETNFLSGNIPSEVGRTRTMTDLNLGFNRLKGPVPTQIGELQQLVELRFASNELSGVVPTELGRLNSLETLGLSENLFTSTFPTHIGLLWKLKDLRGASIGIGGFVPTELGLLTDMQRLELGYNGFTGNLISEIGQLTNMFYFSINDNRFEGTIPSEIGNLKNMTRMQFQRNRFEGNIPFTIGELSKMTQYTLEGNKLGGVIPQEVCDLTKDKLKQLIVDCYDKRLNEGYECEPECCSLCRDVK